MNKEFWDKVDFDVYLDVIYGSVRIAGASYQTSDLIKHNDAARYMRMYLDWVKDRCEVFNSKDSEIDEDEELIL